MAKKNKNAANSIDPKLTLAQLSERYLEHMEQDGKAVGTCFSYTMELKTALAELGADTIVSEITPALIESFNNCDRVMRLKSGKPKAEPSFLKTRRVLRLALGWAEQSGLIAKSPVPTKYDVVPEATPEPTKVAKPRKAKRTDVETPAPEEAVTPAA